MNKSLHNDNVEIKDKLSIDDNENILEASDLHGAVAENNHKKIHDVILLLITLQS
jgi:hypothetical protein